MQFRSRGFTLLEMMVVVALAAILLGIAVPSFKDFIVGQRVKTAAYSFASAAIVARSEAIKRNANVVMTQTTGGWQNGWSVTTLVGVPPTIATLNQQDSFPSVTIANVSTTSPSCTSVSLTALTYPSSGRMSGDVCGFQFGGSLPRHTRCITFGLDGLPKSRLGVCE